MPRRTAHPNVTLRSRKWPSGKVTWFGRWWCPDRRKRIDTNLTKLGKYTKAEMEQWAILKSADIEARLAALDEDPDSPAPPVPTTTRLAAARDAYFADLRASGRLDSTIRMYGFSLDKLARLTPDVPLEAWDGPLLFRVRSAIASDRSIVPATVNKDMAHIKAACHYWRRMGWLRLTKDAINDTLTRVPGAYVQPRPMSRDEIDRFVAACILHDEKHPTRHPWTPILLTMLLTGMRRHECLGLTWSQVHLDEEHPRLIVWARKTRRERTVELDLCPTVIQILSQQPQTGPLVWGEIPPDSRINGWFKSLRERYDVRANCDRLRETSASYCTAHPHIGAAQSALRHGHSILTAERNYLGLVRVPRDAVTIEDAMGIPCNTLEAAITKTG